MCRGRRIRASGPAWEGSDVHGNPSRYRGRRDLPGDLAGAVRGGVQRRTPVGGACRPHETRPARRPSACRGAAGAGGRRRGSVRQEARMTRERDEILEHEADGIREFDNDLPRWWLYCFYFTIVLAALYLVNFHVLPVPLVGPASIQAEYEADIGAAAAARPPATASAVSTGGASGGSVAM